MISRLHAHFTQSLDPQVLDPQSNNLETHEGDALAILRNYLEPNVLITHGQAIPFPPTYDILVDGRPSREQLLASPNLRVVLIPFAGVPTATRTLLADFPHLALHNLHHNAEIVAEFAFGLLLAAAKDLARGDRELRQGDWSLRYGDHQTATLLRGKTALILGYGAIGARLADYCRAFGMTVLATKRTLPPDAPHFLYPPAALRDLLPRADVLLITLPHTSTTDGLLGAAELALLPDRAILINVGRAAIVDAAALFDALQSRRLLAAASDVWWNYPADQAAQSHTYPADLPFHALENFTLSPHRAGHVDETERLRYEHIGVAIRAMANGEPIPHVVDLDAGY